MSSRHILLVSLGNPPPYENTFHSVGHLVLDAIRAQSSALLSQSLPLFSREKLAKKHVRLSSFFPYTLIQSPTLMNVTGPWLARLYNESSPRGDAALVLLHDELEARMGSVAVKKWSASHRGHNGIRSVQGSMGKVPPSGANWARIAIGIGRPRERHSEVVSNYVLGAIPETARLTFVSRVPALVVERLGALQAEWDAGDVNSKPEP